MLDLLELLERVYRAKKLVAPEPKPSWNPVFCLLARAHTSLEIKLPFEPELSSDSLFPFEPKPSLDQILSLLPSQAEPVQLKLFGWSQPSTL